MTHSDRISYPYETAMHACACPPASVYADMVVCSSEL